VLLGPRSRRATGCGRVCWDSGAQSRRKSAVRFRSSAVTTRSKWAGTAMSVAQGSPLRREKASEIQRGLAIETTRSEALFIRARLVERAGPGRERWAVPTLPVGARLRGWAARLAALRARQKGLLARFRGLPARLRALRARQKALRLKVSGLAREARRFAREAKSLAHKVPGPVRKARSFACKPKSLACEVPRLARKAQRFARKAKSFAAEAPRSARESKSLAPEVLRLVRKARSLACKA